MAKREPTGQTAGQRNRARSGPGAILVAVYGVLALAATARSLVQITTKFSLAPVPFLLSAFAAAVYVVATVALVRSSLKVALAAVLVELVGVVTVGIASLGLPQEFPEPTVWSDFGQGYGYVPLILPILGLAWLAHLRRSSGERVRYSIT